MHPFCAEMQELRQNRTLFDLLSVDLSYEGWRQQQQIKEMEAKQNPGSRFAINADDEDGDDDQNAYLDWLFGDKPLPDEFRERPTVWRKDPPPANTDEMDEDDDFEELNARLKNYRK